MSDPNPMQAQFYRNTAAARMARETGDPPPKPLVLIHDGGGSSFNYFTLGALDRDVWTVHSPTYRTGAPFEGGMDQIARQYIKMLQKAGIKGKILLGGWSLGGYLSITMAHIIASAPQDFTISVSGLLLMDSPWLLPGRSLDQDLPKAALFGAPELVRKSLDNVHKILYDWQVPQWYGAGDGSKKASWRIRGRKLEAPPAQALYRALSGEWKSVPYEREYKEPAAIVIPEEEADTAVAPEPQRTPTQGPPPAVLFRSVDVCPTAGRSTKRARVDQFRDEPLLGWDGCYNRDMIRAVIEARSHHYDIFNARHTKEITQSVRDGIQILESFTLEK